MFLTKAASWCAYHLFIYFVDASLLFLKREPPAMFRKEKDDISKYMMEISSSSADDPVHVNNQIDNFYL